MTTSTNTSTTNPAGPGKEVTRPSRRRRAALAVTGFLTCALPVTFTVTVSRMLFSGIETDHRFHQATGQGLILFALWLGGLLPLIRAGWRGRRASTSTGLLFVTFVSTGIVCAAVAPGGGAPILVGVIAITGALLWWALPRRPRLRSRVQLDPVLTPFALAVTAFFTPYALDQIALQNAATSGYHAQNPHLFDMAWLVTAVMALALLAAVLPAARSLVGWVAGSCLGIGLAGLAFGEGTAWSLVGLALGGVATALFWMQHRVAR